MDGMEELMAVQKQLATAKSDNIALRSTNDELQKQLHAQADVLTQKQHEFSSTVLKFEEQLAGKESEVIQAIKKKELARERRSDALLATRNMTLGRSHVVPSRRPTQTIPPRRHAQRDSLSWEKLRIEASTQRLCACLTRPLVCEPDSPGCLVGQPDWKRTVVATREAGMSLSHLERLLVHMRNRLRVYMYALPAHAAHARTHTQRGYMVEGAFHTRMSSSPLRTMAAHSANLFYVPVHPIGCHSQKQNPLEGGHRSNLRSIASCSNEAARVVASLGQWPYLARRGGGGSRVGLSP